MADIRACGICTCVMHELTIEAAVLVRKSGLVPTHPECAALAPRLRDAYATIVHDTGFDRCRHRAGTVGGRCLDCGAEVA